MTDLTRTTIKRRHKCEVCQTIYVCDACTDVFEQSLVRQSITDHSKHTDIVMFSPECMRKFVCPECTTQIPRPVA